MSGAGQWAGGAARSPARTARATRAVDCSPGAGGWGWRAERGARAPATRARDGIGGAQPSAGRPRAALRPQRPATWPAFDAALRGAAPGGLPAVRAPAPTPSLRPAPPHSTSVSLLPPRRPWARGHGASRSRRRRQPHAREPPGAPRVIKRAFSSTPRLVAPFEGPGLTRRRTAGGGFPGWRGDTQLSRAGPSWARARAKAITRVAAGAGTP